MVHQIVSKLFIYFLLFFPTVLFSQQKTIDKVEKPVDHSRTEWVMEMQSKKPNIYTAEKAYKIYFDRHPEEESKWRSIFRRWVENAQLSMDSQGNYLDNPYAPNEYLSANANAASLPGTWYPIGPFFGEKTKCGTSSNLSGGFCDRVYINPYNTNNLFAGFSYGGLWVSQDQGTTWDLTDADIPNGTNTYANRDLYYGEIEASSLNSDLIFAATEYALLKSTDAGENWAVCPELNRGGAGDIRSYFLALSANDADIILTTFGRKVYRSDDGGNSWSVVFDNSNGGPNHQYTNQYSNNSNYGIYERTYNFFGLETVVNQPNTYYLGVYNAQNNPEIHKSVDGGLTFQLLVNLNQNLGRNLPSNLDLIANQEASNDFFVHSLFAFDSLYTYNSNGNLLNRNPINAQTNTYGTQVTTLEALGINPNNQQEMYVGFYFASAIMKSTNGGLTFTDQTSGYGGCPKYVHPDIRSIDVQGDIVLIGSDGGLAISKDGMNTVSSNIGREISSIDLWGFSSSNRTDLLVVGCDHGPTKVRRYIGENGWISLGGGDASDCSINSSNEDYIVFDRAVGNQHIGRLNATNDLTNQASINNSVSLNLVAFHPNLFPIAYLKEGSVLKKTSNNFTSFEDIWDFNSEIRRIIIAPDNKNVLYVLTNNKKVWKTDNEGTTWSEITPSLNAGSNNIIDMAIGDEENEIYLGYGNWQNGIKLAKSADGGTNWENLTTPNLPVAPLSHIRYQQGTNGGIYLAFAGGAGVWYRNNSMAQWEELGSGLPMMGFVRNVFTVPNKGKIRLGGGRGIWEHDLYEASKPIANFSIENNQILCGDVVQFIQTSTHAPEGVSYSWSFEGGIPATSEESAPSIIYASPGRVFRTLRLSRTKKSRKN